MPIDFVITWVDGNDQEWQKEKAKYQGKSPQDNSNSSNRYRDWDLLRYWFRGVEQFAPWVNQIYFVTCGQKPEWLNEDHPKLKLVNHKDFIPEEYLPTFNSSTIEMNIHRIPGLSECFVNFNDDMFLTAPVEKEDFFSDGKAVERAMLSHVSAEVSWDIFPHALINNLSIINTHFQKKQVLKKNLGTFFHPALGKEALRNLYMVPGRFFNGFKDDHLPSPYFRHYFDEIWEAEYETLHKGSLNKFRSREDITEWVVKNWQFCSGVTRPRSEKFGRCYQLGRDQGYEKAIRNGSYKAVCLNDSYTELFDFEIEKKKLKRSFESLLPLKSEFERF